jgi:membrane peptidoglycan carboxypeptidase
VSPERKASTSGSSSGGGARRPTQQRPGQKKPPPKKGRRASLPRRILKWFALGLLAFFLLAGAAFAIGYASTDIPDPNKDFTAQTTFVYYSDGVHKIGHFASQNRTSIPLSDVPRNVQDAVIAAEDRTFYTNKGIDPKGILRAAFSNARGNATQGASTITQQYVKVFYLSQERTFSRKIKEAFVSLKLQRQTSKDEILQGYLNTIYFGRGAYGIQAAAQAYFDEDAKHLNVAQGAVLAAIINSPTALDPAGGADNRQRLLGRYQYVLDGMASAGDISASKAERLGRKLPKFPKVARDNQYGGQRGHMLTLVHKQLLAKGFSEEQISRGGLKVTTTFSLNAMHAAKQAVVDQKPKGLKQLHVAVASVDPRTGALRGMYGGQNYLKSQINWATAGGSPGSAFKPFALSAGIQDGYSLKSTFQGNSPYTFPGGEGTVVNEGGGGGTDYGARISLLKATEDSVNTAYADLTASMDHGPQRILSSAVKMGIPRDAPGLKPYLGIALGSATISPIDMANAYGTIADGGKVKKWYVISKVTDSNGRDEYKVPDTTDRAVPYNVDRDVSYALQQVVRAGTGQNALALGRPAAGKTGTATNQAGDVSSSWFVGYTPQLSTAVMYVRGDGNDALNGYLPSYFGADYPTRTWTEAMKETLDNKPIEQFPPPANVAERKNDHRPLPTFTPTPSPTKTTKPKPSRTPSRTPSSSPPSSAPPSSAPPSGPSSPASGGSSGPLPNPANGGGGDGGGNGGGNGGGQAQGAGGAKSPAAKQPNSPAARSG